MCKPRLRLLLNLGVSSGNLDTQLTSSSRQYGLLILVSGTGAGRVLRRDGHYADALRKGHLVTLFACETSGGVSPSFDALLRGHDRLARSPGTVDHTTYGLSTSNTRSYRRHYLAWHSHVVVLADADTLLLAAETLGRALAC